MALSRSFVKLVLFIFNAVFLVASIVIVGIGLWSVIDKVYISHIIGNDTFSAAAYIIIVSGLIVFGVCILGFMALLKENRILTIVAFILWILIFILLFVAGILAVVFRSELEDKMRLSMRGTLTNKYGGYSTDEQSATSAWNRVQRELRCCSVDNKDWVIYTNTQWFRDQDPRDVEIAYVPASCCVIDPRSRTYINQNQCQTWQLGPPRNPSYDLTNNALYSEGCYSAAKEFVMDAAAAIVGVGFAFALTLIIGIVFTFLFLRLINNLDDEEIRRRQRGKTPNDGL